jgi:hypothetical protein
LIAGRHGRAPARAVVEVEEPLDQRILAAAAATASVVDGLRGDPESIGPWPRPE